MKLQKMTVIESAAMFCSQTKGRELLRRYANQKVRLMSFALTVRQMKAQIKTVTRRHTAKNIKPGHLILAVEKARGVKVENRIPIAILRVVSVRRETLADVTPEECVLEGFPELSPMEFIDLYIRGNSISKRLPVTEIECTRIEFKFEMML